VPILWLSTAFAAIVIATRTAVLFMTSRRTWSVRVSDLGLLFTILRSCFKSWILPILPIQLHRTNGAHPVFGIFCLENHLPRCAALLQRIYTGRGSFMRSTETFNSGACDLAVEHLPINPLYTARIQLASATSVTVWDVMQRCPCLSPS
jgi:hypothetical protein